MTNLDNVCRLCLSSEYELSPIAKHLELSYNKHCTTNLDQIMLVCIGITVRSDDNFPKWICSQCIYQLLTSYSFREKCLESIKYLEQVKIKQESTLDIDTLEKITAYNEQDCDYKDVDTDCDYKGFDPVERLESEEKGEVQRQKSPNLCTATSGFDDSMFKFTCDICGYNLKSMKSIANHMQRVHIEKITSISTVKSTQNPFECAICKNAYPNRKSFYRHKYRVHGLRKVKENEPKRRQKKLQICPICGVARTEIRAHMATHSDTRDYKCETCGISVKTADSLKRHIQRVHSEKRPYPCTICNVSFKTFSNLKNHNKKHTQERNYECQYCHRSFSDAAKLDRHINNLHIQQPSIACEFCGKLFMTNERLSNHIGIHTLEKKFKCGLGSCPRTFVNSSSASVHRRTHTINNLYHCSDCTVGFKELILLKMHLKKEGHHFEVATQNLTKNLE